MKKYFLLSDDARTYGVFESREEAEAFWRQNFDSKSHLSIYEVETNEEPKKCKKCGRFSGTIISGVNSLKPKIKNFCWPCCWNLPTFSERCSQISNEEWLDLEAVSEGLMDVSDFSEKHGEDPETFTPSR